VKQPHQPEYESNRNPNDQKEDEDRNQHRRPFICAG
jgi:hypothetical protein